MRLLLRLSLGVRWLLSFFCRVGDYLFGWFVGWLDAVQRLEQKNKVGLSVGMVLSEGGWLMVLVGHTFVFKK